jgi:SAM-dependent methyltransferase
MEIGCSDLERAYWEQRLGPDVPLHAVGFQGLSNTYVAWLYRVRAHRFLTLVRPLVRAGMHVLDAGSGGGFCIDLWRRLGVERIVAGDLTQASLDALAQRFPQIETKRFNVADQALPLPEQAFDAVSCFDVMHHIVDDQAYRQALRNFARTLRPGGHLIFTDNFLHADRGLVAPHSAYRPLHQIESLLKDAGFVVEVRRPVFVLMNCPVDSRNPIFKFYWKVMDVLCGHPVAGYVLGAVLYPLELALTSLLREGPSTELCIARRASGV